MIYHGGNIWPLTTVILAAPGYCNI